MNKEDKQQKYFLHKVCKAFLVLIAVFCCSCKVYAAGNIPSDFFVEYTLPQTDFTYKVRLWRGVVDDGLDFETVPVTVKSHVVNSERYYLSLPAEMQGESVKILFPEEIQIQLDDKDIYSGYNMVDLPAGKHRLVCNGEENILEVIYLSDIPCVYITTETVSMDSVNMNKGIESSGHIKIMNGGKIEYDGAMEYIKGRGNSTWFTVKKPYNIKLAAKANIFGMGAAKKYSLLADYYDRTRLRNTIAYKLAGYVGIEYAPEAYNINLFIDNHYYGMYTFAENIEINDNRIEIFDLEEVNEALNPGVVFEECETGTAIRESNIGQSRTVYWTELPNDSAELDGGYLLELDFTMRDSYKESGFISSYGQAVVITSPQYASQSQVEYISRFYQEMEDALLSDDGYNALGMHYSEYIDVESFAKMYVYQEYVKNLDSGLSSFYIYKDVGGKMYAGPVWDMDSTLGKENIINGNNLADPQGIWAADMVDYTQEGKYSVLALCYKHNDFKKEAARQWNEFFKPVMDTILQDTVKLGETMQNSAVSDLSYYNAGQGRETSKFEDQYMAETARLKEFIGCRAQFLDEYFNHKKVHIQYCSTGGRGVMIDANAYTSGSEAVVLENKYDGMGRIFAGWNTQPDGSGEWYYPGDNVEIETEDVYLFAQWNGETNDYIYREPPVHNKTLFEIIVDFFNKN